MRDEITKNCILLHYNSDQNISETVSTITIYIIAGVSLSTSSNCIKIPLYSWKDVPIKITNLGELNDTFQLNNSYPSGIYAELGTNNINLT